ncbi:DNA transposition protein, partial [Rhodoplanes roseus]
NVAAFSALITRVVERDLSLPGLATFYGPSGLGKTKSAIYGANRYRAAYVECGQYTTAKSLLVSILTELGLTRPRGTVAELIAEAIRLMAADISKPL